MALSVTTIAARPDLAEPVARWLWEEWGRKKGRPFERTLGMVSSRTAPRGLEQCFVLLDGEAPAGTASLAAEDADSRPDLSPWLASVFVAPEARGRGYGRVLVTAVESAAREAGFATLWLFTDSAAALYAGLGWRDAGTVLDQGRSYALMRRDLAPHSRA
jgi:GNAT superfamily N-acetyltransferase